MKILVGVDDSPHSQAALDFVKSMKWPTDTRVVVVAVARPVIGAYSMAEVGGSTWVHQALEEEVGAQKELAARHENELRDAGFHAEALVLRGDPRESLIEAARDARADLLVVGSHGRTGFSKLLMGSVASHVVTHAPCNVVVVKRLPGAK